MKDLLRWCALGCALGASGCTLEDVDSDAIRTQGMFADMLALAPGDGSTLVRVRLTVGGESGTNVTLVGDDRLLATAGGVTEQLPRTGRGRYERPLPGEASGEISVQLSRGPDDASAGGTATLPEPFVAALDTDASEGIARDQAVAVSWSPAVPGGALRWSVEGRCLWSESGTTADDGALVLGPESFRVRGSRRGDECEAELRLDREAVGDVDSIWVPGSRFRAVQRRSVRFVSTPAGGEAAEPAGGDAG